MATPTCSSDKAEMVWHCEVCQWWTCPSCGAVNDLERGYRITRAGVVESVAE